MAVTEKNVTFDLLCRNDETGEEFLVEVQNSEEDSFMDRMLCYATYPIRDQLEERVMELKEGKNLDHMDYSLMPVYVICMANFKLQHQSEEALEEGYVCRYELRNGRNGELMTPNLNFVFLEMGRLKLKEGEEDLCGTLLEKFIFSMKYMHTMKRRPASFDDPMLGRLYTAAEIANLTVKQRQNYEKAMFTELDRIAQLNFAKKAGVAEGREEGIALSLRAKSLLKEGKSVQDVCEETGLSEEIVSELAN